MGEVMEEREEGASSQPVPGAERWHKQRGGRWCAFAGTTQRKAARAS